MSNVYIASDNIISSLGFTTDENMKALHEGISGIKLHDDADLAPAPFWASVINRNILSTQFKNYGDPESFTRFEQMLICSIKNAVEAHDFNMKGKDVLLIISTTKGNIDLLDDKYIARYGNERKYLWSSAQSLKNYFELANTPMVVSNACISGVMAIIVATRLIRAGKYNHVIVAGADMVTEFVVSGFNSFLSLCDGPCKPFDKERTGLSLGEAAGSIVLTNQKPHAKQRVNVGHGYSSNDANHISGPSRTGEGLYIAITKALHDNRQVDYISAHGTATPYNDEMESIAITRAGLSEVPVNSLKGYWGHTLGAAGIIESIACFDSLKNNRIFNTKGYAELGVSNRIAVVDRNINQNINACLKIASGFGGCNAAITYYK